MTADQQGTVRAIGNGNGTATIRAMSVDGSGKYADIDIKVSGYSGIEAITDGSAASGHLTAWPSPAITEVTVGGLEADGGELYIFSLGSQIMLQEKVSETSATIDCSMWTPDVYIAKQGSHTVKFIKR